MIERFIGLIASLMIVTTEPALAEPKCRDMPTGRTLEAEAKAGKPINEIVEALLRDAEKLYAESAHIVGRRPRTEAESNALQETDLLIEECHFQQAFSSAAKAATELSDRWQWALIRIEQFDNFIFGAIRQVIACSNTEAGRRLRISRELLDHAWVEFKGDTRERDWDPKLDWPETHERCVR